MEITKDKLKEMINYIDVARMESKDERVQEAYGKVVAGAKNGLELMGGNEEKKAWLNYVLCDQAYRITFYLWRHRLFHPGSKIDYGTKIYEFTLPEDAIEYARSFTNKENEARQKLSSKAGEIDTYRREIDIFKDILAGKDPKQAEADMAAYVARMESMMNQMPDQPPVMQ